MTKKIHEWKLTDRRGIGRPKMRWKNYKKKIVLTRNLNLTNAEDRVGNRSWKIDLAEKNPYLFIYYHYYY